MGAPRVEEAIREQYGENWLEAIWKLLNELPNSEVVANQLGISERSLYRLIDGKLQFRCEWVMISVTRPGSGDE